MNDKHMFYDTTEPHPQHLKVHKRDFKQNFYLFVLRACVEVKMYHGKRVAIRGQLLSSSCPLCGCGDELRSKGSVVSA